MDYSAIEEMYNGKRGKCDQIKNTPKYTKCLQNAIEKEKAFCAELEKYPRLCELYEELQETQASVNMESAQSRYAEGFRFGFLMGLDVAKV